MKNPVYEEINFPIQDIIINKKHYIPFSFMMHIYPIDEIISHQGKLYIRPLSLKELKEISLNENNAYFLTHSEINKIFKFKKEA